MEDRRQRQMSELCALMATAPDEARCRLLAAAYAQGVVDYLSNLFTATPKDQFSRDEVLIILNEVRNDPELMLELLDHGGAE